MSEMLKVQGGRIKGSAIRPSKAIAIAMPAGHTAAIKRGEEQAQRAKMYREQMEQAAAERAAAAAARQAERNAEAKRRIEEKKQRHTVDRKRDPTKMWDNYQLIADITQTHRKRITVAACTKDGFRFVNIRQFYRTFKDMSWRPSHQGIIIPLVSVLSITKSPDPDNPPTFVYPMQDTLGAIQQAMEVAATMELDDPENAVWKLPKTKETDNNENSRT